MDASEKIEKEDDLLEEENSLQDILSNDAIEEQNERSTTNKLVEPNLYRGEALTEAELYQLSAEKKIDMILVIGPVHSGKTTMEVMWYYMFLQGEIKNIKFAGSRTLRGVVQRMGSLRVESGNGKAEVERTSVGNPETYLHLAIMDSRNVRREIVFPDISGELVNKWLVDKEQQKQFAKNYKHLENVIIVIDGEKITIDNERQKAISDWLKEFFVLKENDVITMDTRVHLVYTKYDQVKCSDMKEKLEEFINSSNDRIRRRIEGKCKELHIHQVAALSLNKEKVPRFWNLEQLLVDCLEKNKVEKKSPPRVGVEFSQGLRSFDKFTWKE